MLPRMRVLVIGATGTIGSAVTELLQREGHEVLSASRHGELQVDITDVESVGKMYERAGAVDAVVCAAGSGAWKPLAELTDDDFRTSLQYKLMGQVNVIRAGLDSIARDGSITVTSGILSRKPMEGSAAISLVNSGLEGFVRAASLEARNGIRVNVVSPPWVSETLAAMGTDPSKGLPASAVAQAYLEAVTGTMSGETIEPQ